MEKMWKIKEKLRYYIYISPTGSMRTQPSLPYTYNIIILLVYFFLTFNLCIFPLYILLIEIYIQIFFVCLCCVFFSTSDKAYNWVNITFYFIVIIIDSFPHLLSFTLYFMFYLFSLLLLPFLPQNTQNSVFDVSLDIESILKNILYVCNFHLQK